MEDIFGFDTTPGVPGFTDQQGTGIFFTSGGNLKLVQQWNVQYQLQVQSIYECGTSTVYFAAKHGAGTMTIDRILAGDSQELTDLGTVCNPQPLTLTAYSSCDRAPKELKMQGCILAGVTYSGQAQQAYVSENVTVQFAGLGKAEA